ncbi:MAG: nucleoside triphosphate pyrophosphohydrolase [Candidatus Eremiobacteraeota bacterium]|nr:nucleoside triphosphate pyrophosphohydrolase [Candidatus Eremiobacteraeota bacterium]MBV8498164.1 nucleoside triphosphate pyrophosphohydrolase [Candidatus Eremiobacteraeota bacterium]
MLVRIAGLGPGDPRLLTIGTLDALRAIGKAVVLLAPPDLTSYLERNGVAIVRGMVEDPALLVRGSGDEIARFAQRLDDASLRDGALGLGVLGNPLSDFPGLPALLRTLESRKVATEILPGVPRATLSAAITMPLVPLPPQSSHYSWDDLVEIMARLRLGCPWDREQTHRTLVPYLIEETFEVVEAIELSHLEGLCEELGDLLLQVLFHAQIATEVGKFSIADVVDALSNKMVRRHPHVFGDAVIEDVDAQWRNWERLKALEKTGRRRKSRLDGIPKHLGALQRGQRMQEKAARVGFDWPNVGGVLDKLSEELRELAEARRNPQDDPRVREELGDVFFTLVNLSRALGIDAETALREANEKFYRRFAFMEERAGADGKNLSDLSLDELEELWELAKA